MRVAYLANSFHLNKTKSTDFLIELLKLWFDEVSVIPHKEAWARLPGTKWDLLISFQHLWKPEELEAFGARRTVLVPMFDDCPHDEGSWRPYLGFGILSFSKTLGDQLSGWGHEVLVVQYWQSVPEARAKVEVNRLKGFFWPRTRSIGWTQIQPLLTGTNWGGFHLHVTNTEGAQSGPTDEERARLRMVQTSWFDRPEDYQKVLAEASVFFAPRGYEGIGQAVLEALALGMVVVAPDAPTMNEYIVSGENGLLFEPEDPQPLDLKKADALAQRARDSAVAGRARWEASLPSLREFLVVAPQSRPRRFHPWIILRGRATALLRAGFRLLKKVAGRA